MEPNCAFADLLIRQFRANPFPDPVGCMPLLPRSFPIQFQNLINKACYRRQLETRRAVFSLNCGSALPSASRLCAHVLLASLPLRRPCLRRTRTFCGSLRTTPPLISDLTSASAVGCCPHQSIRPSRGWAEQNAELDHIRVLKARSILANSPNMRRLGMTSSDSNFLTLTTARRWGTTRSSIGMTLWAISTFYPTKLIKVDGRETTRMVKPACSNRPREAIG